MANEALTEDIVINKLRKLGYYDDEHINVTRQSSPLNEVNKLLKNASKSGKRGKGYPDFLIKNDQEQNYIVIYECKADVRDHDSGNFKTDNYNNIKKYAVDGVLHYAKYLSSSYNVIAIAASGQTEDEFKTTTFIHPKGSEEAKILSNKNDSRIEDIISFKDYVTHALYDPAIAKIRENDLIVFSQTLHKFLWKYAKVTEEQKPLIVSGTLIALMDDFFRNSYSSNTNVKDLSKQWYDTIKKILKNSNINFDKIETMCQPYSGIRVHAELNKKHKAYEKGILHEIITMIKENVFLPFMSVFSDFDIVGQFYGEFLKYTGGDKKSLGIVLTPRHITELFSLIGNVNKHSKVLDICTGTGGFLISAMHHMIKDAQTNEEIDIIKRNGLIGIEQQPHMFALAASNMILRGDGKANLHQGSCFDSAMTNAVKESLCDVGMINPPYSQEDELSELNFVKRMLDCLDKGAIGIAIVPMSCAIGKDPMKEILMKEHTLEAVMSMPDELFYPVGTVTCIMVWKAHTPHRISDKMTWFGYWKNDGFEKTKTKGRYDINESWSEIRDRWIESYRNRLITPGMSIQEKVSFNDEWCAEAYLVTDYSTISKKTFEEAVKSYALYKIVNNHEKA